jgi:hypothetical protein
MKMILKNSLYLFFAGLSLAQAKENVNYGEGGATGPTQTLAYNCAAGTAQTLLDINNVKTTILNGGDMWWDLSNGRYEIPKGSAKHSMFAGALWIGGLDENEQIKVAGQTYRQSGSDYWPGPLDNVRLTSQNPCWKATIFHLSRCDANSDTLTGSIITITISNIGRDKSFAWGPVAKIMGSSAARRSTQREW